MMAFAENDSFRGGMGGGPNGGRGGGRMGGGGGQTDKSSDAELQAGLDNYAAAVEKFVSLTPEQRSAFTVIGGIKNTGWGTDFEMTQDPEGTWTSKEAFELNAGDEFKVRQGASWDVNYGANGVAGGDNIKVEADGNYKVQLVIAGETVTVTLIPVE